jgi:hypothetical protein
MPFYIDVCPNLPCECGHTHTEEEKKKNWKEVRFLDVFGVCLDDLPKPPIEWITDLQNKQDNSFSLCCSIPQFWTIIERALNTPLSTFYYKDFLNTFKSGYYYRRVLCDTFWGKHQTLKPSITRAFDFTYKSIRKSYDGSSIKDKEEYIKNNLYHQDKRSCCDMWEKENKQKKHLNERYHTHTKKGKPVKSKVDRLIDFEPYFCLDPRGVPYERFKTNDAKRIAYNTLHREKYEHIKGKGDLEIWANNVLSIMNETRFPLP